MKSRFLMGVVVCALVLLIANVTQAQDASPSECQEASLPSHDPKFPEDQLILVCRPADWNENLVHAHGFVPPQAPLVLPIAELTLADGTFVPSLLLAQGFAFATSSFHKNGAATQQAVKDLGDLLNYFKTLVQRRLLKKVFIIGASEGGLPVMRLIEKQPDKYNAALALCAPVGGAPEQIQYAGDFRVVFDYFFPGVFTFPPGAPGEQPFGAFSVPEDAFLFWDSDYVPRIMAAISNDPTAAGHSFSVTGAAVDPKIPPTTAMIETAVSLLLYSIWETNDIIAITGGIPYDNRSTVYVGSADDAALNAGVERIKGDPRAQSYTRRFYQTTGELQRPVVTLHNTLDPIAPFQHEVTYSQLVAAAGSSDFLTEIPVEGYGHCDFTTEEILRAFGLMVQRATGSVQP